MLEQQNHRHPRLEDPVLTCYLPRELMVAILTAVHIPPYANVSKALDQLQLMVSKQQRAHPDGVHIVTGDTSRLFSPNFINTSSDQLGGKYYWTMFVQINRHTGHSPTPTRTPPHSLSLPTPPSEGILWTGLSTTLPELT